MNIYLVRHPETVRNVENKLTGWEFSPYSDTGKIQFEKIKNYFKGKALSVYSSDLPRALMLGEKIASATGGELFVDKGLRERNFKETLPMDSFEDVEVFRKRVFDWVDENKMKDIVIVSHAGTVREIVFKLLGHESLKEISAPRDVILKIETVKNENKLLIIQT